MLPGVDDAGGVLRVRALPPPRRRDRTPENLLLLLDSDGDVNVVDCGFATATRCAARPSTWFPFACDRAFKMMMLYHAACACTYLMPVPWTTL